MGQTSLDEHLKFKTYFLFGCAYDGKEGKAYLKLLDIENNQVEIIYDESGHKPYCYVLESLEEVEKLKLQGVVKIEVEKKYDLFRDREVKLTKIIASDPLAIGGTSASIREKMKAWEADIPYHLCYLYDMRLIPSIPYRLDGKILEPLEQDREKIRKVIEKYFPDLSRDDRKVIEEWIALMEAEHCKLKHLSLDIEVLSPVATRVPSPDKARDKVVAVSMVGSDGRREVYLLKTPNFIEVDGGSEFTVKVFDDEVEMLKKIYEVIEEYPVVATFNGDDFDLPYLRHRGEQLKIPKDKIPIILSREGASLRKGIHIDLYRLFNNKSIQVYAFDNKYREHTLEAIAQALIGKGKIAIDKPISQLTSSELARYSFYDALLVHELLTFDDELLLKLIIVISRISRLPIEDVCRHGVSGWIKS
ncbi:MAG: 3'-5' exonuclease, partial [Nitrososphaerota archaeon]